MSEVSLVPLMLEGASPRIERSRRRWYLLLERFPRAYCAYQRFRFPTRQTVGTTTDIVIEGFPGSGNSFAREAFLLANPGSVVASHHHRPAQVREALRLGKPVLVLLRPPAAAISSFVAREPHIRVGDAIQDYRRLYDAVLPLADQVVIGRFDDVQARFGELIDAVNARFGTSFAAFPHGDDQAVAAVLERLAAYGEEVFGSEAAWRMSAPSSARSERKAEARAAYHASAAGLRLRCEALHEKLDRRAALTGRAGAPAAGGG